MLQSQFPDELLSNLVADDADGTKAAVEAFTKMYKDAVQAACHRSASSIFLFH